MGRSRRFLRSLLGETPEEYEPKYYEMNKKISTFRIYFLDKDYDGFDEYVEASSAQEAVDYVREHFDAKEVINVAKIVKCWK